MRNSESAAKATPQHLLTRAGEKRERPERLSWPLAVLVIAILSGLGWLAMVYGIGRLIAP